MWVHSMKNKNTMTIKFRISPKLFSLAKSRANRFYDGNLSLFLREAISDHKIKRPPQRKKKTAPKHEEK